MSFFLAWNGPRRNVGSVRAPPQVFEKPARLLVLGKRARLAVCGMDSEKSPAGAQCAVKRTRSGDRLVLNVELTGRYKQHTHTDVKKRAEDSEEGETRGGLAQKLCKAKQRPPSAHCSAHQTLRKTLSSFQYQYPNTYTGSAGSPCSGSQCSTPFHVTWVGSAEVVASPYPLEVLCALLVTRCHRPSKSTSTRI